jgi:hypothetical protein
MARAAVVPLSEPRVASRPTCSSGSPLLAELVLRRRSGVAVHHAERGGLGVSMVRARVVVAAVVLPGDLPVEWVRGLAAGMGRGVRGVTASRRHCACRRSTCRPGIAVVVAVTPTATSRPHAVLRSGHGWATRRARGTLGRSAAGSRPAGGHHTATPPCTFGLAPRRGRTDGGVSPTPCGRLGRAPARPGRKAGGLRRHARRAPPGRSGLAAMGRGAGATAPWVAAGERPRVPRGLRPGYGPAGFQVQGRACARVHAVGRRSPRPHVGWTTSGAADGIERR